MTDNDDQTANHAETEIVVEARSLADRARRDGISADMPIQAATLKLRPRFAAAVAYALEAGWLDNPSDQEAAPAT